MNKDLKQDLENFLEESKPETKEKKEVVIPAKTGLVERIDKTLVLEDGRQLLKEQLFESK